ncbi:MAG: ABC transporter ATP-binding protein [Spirochaetaceae bacterium]|jgi:branched-chain amino acid transport system ATP-binding protein|nr:ABC transporter ATP-binding protein [Spirochaetaceae bacterium]
MEEAVLEVKDLRARYGNIEVLHGVSFFIKRGEIAALIGSNGASKTSLLYSLARLVPPIAPVVSGGDIIYNNESILKTEPHMLIQKKMMVLVPEGRHIFGNLSVEENLRIATYSYRKDVNYAAIIAEKKELVFSLFPRLFERRKQRSELLSGGEQQMLAVGRALMTGCETILLDEPSMGLAPKLMFEMFKALQKLNSMQHITIIVVEQNAKVALDFSGRAYVLKTGEIIAAGSSAELSSNSDIRKAYLGG